MDEDNRRYRYSDLEERNNKTPVWLIAVYAGLAVFFVLYLVRYFY